MAEARRKVQASAVANTPRGGGYGVVTGNSNAYAILRGLQKFEPALGQLLEQKADRMAQTQAEQDFRDGKKAPPGYAKYIKYQEVHGKLQGAQKASDFHTSLTTWLKANPNATPEEYEKTKAGMLQGGSEGLKGWALDAFLPSAIESIEKSDINFQKRQVEILKEDTSGAISQIAGQSLPKKIEETAPKDLPQVIRDDLSRIQKLNMGGPLDRKDVSRAYLRALGRFAEVNGRPDILDFGFLPDKDGVAVADNPELAEELRTYIERAKTNRDDIDEKKKVLDKEFIANKQSELNLSLHSILANNKLTEQERLEALSSIEYELYKYGSTENNPEGLVLPSGFVNTYTGAIRTVRSFRGFAEIDNGDAIVRLEEAGTELSLEDIQREQGNITKTTYQKYMARFASLTKKGMTKTGREALKMENSYKTPTMRGLSYQNPFGPIFNPYVNAAQRHLRGLTLWNMKIKEAEDALKENEFLAPADYERIGKEVMDRVNVEIPPLLTVEVPTSQPGNAPPKPAGKGGNLGKTVDTRNKIGSM